jgi:hypothetical protein
MYATAPDGIEPANERFAAAKAKPPDRSTPASENRTREKKIPFMI